MDTKKRIIIWVIAGVLVAGALGVSVFMGIVQSSAVRRTRELYIPAGTSFETLVDSLEGKIRFMAAFKKYSKRIGLTERVKPGHYELKRGTNVIRLARMLNLAEQTPVDVVVRFARLPGQLAQRVAGQLDSDSASIHKAMQDPAVLQKYGYTSDLELFTIFIPNTYEMWWTATPEEFIDRMKREYDRFWNSARLAKLPRTGLTKEQVSSLAAIMCEETQKTDEMPIIASVYINRLRKGMLLQADPTVKYAMGDFTLRRIFNRYLKTDSPYNTYMYQGLPPTPICLPSIAAIDAVLNYIDTDFLYFCAKEDFSGYHNFAKTYDQHLANARRYSAALNERNIF